MGSFCEKFLMLVFFDNRTSVEFLVWGKKTDEVLTEYEVWLLRLFWLFLRLRFSLNLSFSQSLAFRLFLGFCILIGLFSGF